MSFDRRRNRQTQAGAGIRVRAFIAIVILLAAAVFELQWVFGVFFLFWSAQGPITGVAFLVEPVYRDENPRLFWTIVGLWFVLSLAFIASDLARWLA